MFPSDWTGYSARAKRAKASAPDAPPEEPPECQIGLVSDLANSIRRSLNQECAPPEPADLGVEYVLSRVPYRNILENLFGDDKTIPDLPLITKSYEESFMRQPEAGERACAMGDMCECRFIDRQCPFTAVEFRLPADPPSPQLCVLCSRKATQKMFYDMCFAGAAPKGVIQRFGNIFGQAGEYSADLMLSCPQSVSLSAMPLPIMSHQRSRYQVMNQVRGRATVARENCPDAVSRQGGVKSLRQQRVAHEAVATPSDTARS